MAFAGGNHILKEEEDPQGNGQGEPNDDSDGLLSSLPTFDFVNPENDETSEKSEKTESTLLENVPGFDDITTQLTDPDKGTIGKPPQQEVQHVPVVSDVMDTVTDTVKDTVEDNAPSMIDSSQKIDDNVEKSKKSQLPEETPTSTFDQVFVQTPDTDQDIEATPVVDDEIDLSSQTKIDEDHATTLSDLTKSNETISSDSEIEATPVNDEEDNMSQDLVSTQVSDDNVSTRTKIDNIEATPVNDDQPQMSSKTEVNVEVSPLVDSDNDKSTVSTLDNHTPIAEEIIVDSIPKDEQIEISHKQGDMGTPQSTEVDVEQDHQTHKDLESMSLMTDSSLLYHDDSHDNSTYHIDDLHSVPVSEEYEAGTQVVAHIPDHHSMQSDPNIKAAVNKHLDDSSNSSEDDDSGVSKIEMTNVKHDSDEHQHTFSNGESNADSNIFGVSSDSNAMATSIATKKVNTEINKIKFQHSRKSQRLILSTIVMGFLLVFIDY
jgi:hypothetical protein